MQTSYFPPKILEMDPAPDHTEMGFWGEESLPQYTSPGAWSTQSKDDAPAIPKTPPDCPSAVKETDVVSAPQLRLRSALFWPTEPGVAFTQTSQNCEGELCPAVQLCSVIKKSEELLKEATVQLERGAPELPAVRKSSRLAGLSPLTGTFPKSKLPGMPASSVPVTRKVSVGWVAPTVVLLLQVLVILVVFIPGDWGVACTTNV